MALPGIPPLRRVWADAVTAALADEAPSFVLDLRSEAYVALGPVPSGTAHAYVRVVTAGPDGAVRALNHFNKHAKGALVRALATSRPRVASRAGLLRWASSAGWTLREGAAGRSSSSWSTRRVLRRDTHRNPLTRRSRGAYHCLAGGASFLAGLTRPAERHREVFVSSDYYSDGASVAIILATAFVFILIGIALWVITSFFMMKISRRPACRGSGAHGSRSTTA